LTRPLELIIIIARASGGVAFKCLVLLFFLIFFQSAEPYSDYERTAVSPVIVFFFSIILIGISEAPKALFLSFFVINQSMPYSLFPPKKNL
jgi:hypothetical protein